MNRELLIHFIATFILFILITFTRGWFSVEFLLFWAGGIIGTLLPDIDHLIYVYYLRPQDYTSQRVNHMVENKQLKSTVNLLVETKDERKQLIFHTILFTLIFSVLLIFVVTSSGSLLGRGIVLAFLLHLLVDAYEEFTKNGNLSRWTQKLPIKMDFNNSRIFLYSVSVLLIITSLFF